MSYSQLRLFLPAIWVKLHNLVVLGSTAHIARPNFPGQALQQNTSTGHGRRNSHLKSAFQEQINQNNFKYSNYNNKLLGKYPEYWSVRYSLEKVSSYKLNEESTFPKHVKIDLSVQISHFKTEHCWLRKSLEFRSLLPSTVIRRVAPHSRWCVAGGCWASSCLSLILGGKSDPCDKLLSIFGGKFSSQNNPRYKTADKVNISFQGKQELSTTAPRRLNINLIISNVMAKSSGWVSKNLPNLLCLD